MALPEYSYSCYCCAVERAVSSIVSIERGWGVTSGWLLQLAPLGGRGCGGSDIFLSLPFTWWVVNGGMRTNRGRDF